jgi:LysM repeat protein
MELKPATGDSSIKKENSKNKSTSAIRLALPLIKHRSVRTLPLRAQNILHFIRFFVLMNLRLIFVLIIALLPLFGNTGATPPTDKETPKLTAQQYIEAWKDEAIYQMVVHKIPASITLSQGLLESGNGNSRLAIEGNNHFGIKCHNDWNGAKIFEDDETKGECFRKYDDASESFEDHSLFLQKKRYESLFTLDIKDYNDWAKGLKECGYATNPKYPQLLINLIEQYQLAQYDKLGLEHIKEKTTPNRSHGKAPNHNPSNNKEDGKTINLSNNRTIKISDNKIKFIIAKAGDTTEKIAADLDIAAWQIKLYNDFQKNDTIKEGQKIYIQPKRSKAKDETHTVSKGETMWSISQNHGIKLKKLYKKNMMAFGSEPTPGQKLKLR